MSVKRVGRHTLPAVVGAAAIALSTSGCLGLGTAGGYVPAAKLAGGLAQTKSMSGASISVGSKNFTENILLGKMAIILLKSAGAKVTDLTNIPGSASARQAMLDGQIDAMWEYTGTGWITYLGHEKPIPNEHRQYVAVRDEDKQKNHLDWLPPAPMNNTYGFAVTKATQQKFHITKLSQLSKVPKSQRTFCVESELINRPDGLKGMLARYGVPLGSGVPRSNLRVYQTGAIYDATAHGNCNFGEVFTTDGRILALHLKVLADDRSFFPKYNVSFVVQQKTLQKYPQIANLFAPVSKKLTNAELLKLNAQVDVDGKEPADVAYAWLKHEGFIK